MPTVDRREFLRRSAAAVAGVSGAAAFPAACAKTNAPRAAASAVPFPRLDAPVTWPVFPDNPQIASGLKPEAGPLRVYEWHEYLSRDVLDSFGQKYGVNVETASFADREEALHNVTTGPQRAFDVFFPTVQQIGQMVQQRLLAPLNHGYLGNIGNLWAQFTGPDHPFYDAGQRYTIPYTVFSTGIAFRTDLVPAPHQPTATGDPYGLFWDPALAGRTGLYDDYREAIAFALLRNGIDDVNTGDPSALRAAERDLADYVTARHGVFTADGVYEDLPSGKLWAHQSWSGDFMAAPYYEQNDPAKITPTFGYVWPRGGIVGVDLIAVLGHAQHPVLGHLFINHLLDTQVSMTNFTWNGYQPPLSGITAATLRGPRWSFAVPQAILTPEQFASGRFLAPLLPPVDALWRQAWNDVRANAPATSTPSARS